MAQPSTSTSSAETYLSGIITGAHGDKYQNDLALVLFERATRKGYDFLLGCEMAIADKFDDVAFFDKKTNRWTLIQTKHAAKSEGKPLQFDMLFPKDDSTRETGDFSLLKYLKSYTIIQENIKEPKNVIIFTNRDLANFKHQSVQVVTRQADEIFRFKQSPKVESATPRDDKGTRLGTEETDVAAIAISATSVNPDSGLVPLTSQDDAITTDVAKSSLNVEPRQLGLQVSHDLRSEMVDYVNRDFNSLRDSIVELFKGGIVNQVIKNYKTPVANMLTKSNNKVRFADNPPREAHQMLESLKSFLDIQTAEVSLEKCRDLFTGKSRNKTWPVLTNLVTVEQFFNDLILFVAQPDDLSDTIDQDMRLWMRTWIRPDYFTRLEKSQLECIVSLQTFFNDKQSSENADVSSSRKTFLQLNDGEKYFDSIERNLKNQIQKLSNYNDNDASKYYISRQIEYVELSDKPGNDIDRENIKKMKMRDDDFVKELHGKFDNQPFHLLIAEPGMGKSTILEYIAMAAQRKYTDYVYLVNLNTFNHKFRNSMETVPPSDHLSILETVLSRECFDYLQKNMQCENKNVRFFMVFDAFDEVFPENRAKVLEMFNQLLKNRNVKLLVSARRNVQTLLENEFKVKPMNLVPFNKDDQINFLEQFWNVSDDNRSSFNKYAAHLFEMLHSAGNHAIYEFIGLPLMLKMLAEVYLNDFKKFLTADRNDTTQIISIKMFNVISLYDQFVKKSFDNKMVKKFGGSYVENDRENDQLFEKFTLEHQLLAIKLLEIDDLDIVLKDKSHKEICDGFEERLVNGSEKSPLVEAFENHKRFIHLSYAEFLVAKFLCYNISIYEAEIFAEESQAKLFNQYPMIRIFFFAMVEEQSDTEHLKILERHYQKNSYIALWACEVHDLETVKYLLRTIYDATIINRLLHVAAEHNCFNICAYLLQNHQVVVNWNTGGRTALHIATAKGHVEFAKLLIDNSAHIEAKDSSDQTPLHIAVKRGELEVAKLLIDNSANIEAKNHFDQTPLHCAARWGQLEVAKMLIDNAANIEAKDNSDYTPLHIAARSGRLEVAKMLIDNSAHIEAKDRFDQTPLHIAAQSGKLEVAKLLIDNSANIEAKARFDHTPLHIAAEKDHVEVANMLINNSANIGAKDHFDQTPLHYAIASGQLEVAKLLIDNSANIEAKDRFDQTPLHIAAERGELEVAKLLIDNSANIEAKDRFDQTPLYIAAESGKLKVAKLLIDNSANIEAKDRFDQTPLHIAALRGQLEVAKLLIDNSAHIEAKDRFDQTPLHYAAASGQLEVAKLLIDNSANIEAKDRFDQTPLHIAALRGQLEVAKLLIDNSAHIEAKDRFDQTPLHIAALLGELEVAKLLIDNSANIEAKDRFDQTPLHIAAQSGKLEVAKLLIDNSANIEAKARFDHTPLHIAAESGKLEVAKLLIDNSANIGAKDNLYETPLHSAARMGELEVIKLLLDNAADIKAENGFGETPVQLAHTRRRKDIIKLLTDHSAACSALK